MAVTYEPISSSTASSVASLTFSSIPSTFTDLVVLYSFTHSTGTQDVYLELNGDTGLNYSVTIVSGTGSSAVSARLGNTATPPIDSYGVPGTTTPGTNVVNLMSYSNTNVYKTFLTASAQAGSGVDRIVGLWRSTSAITTVKLKVNSGTLTGGAALYGIKAA